MAATKETDKVTDGGALTIEDALAMYERYKNYWDENYREANIDLKMAAGDPATHWGEAYGQRKALKKLTIVINELPQFIHQVTNDIRQNTPSISVLPEADGDIETGKIFSGLLRGIEYKSAADEAYDTAAEYAVKCAIGFIRVDHDYCDDETDEQELQVKRVIDPLSNFLDPSSIECDGRDANGAICLDPINKKDFDRLYPGKNFVSFTDPKGTEQKETITLGEIFIREFVGKRGKKAVIHRYKCSGEEILAQTTFPGYYIPLVPVYGEETWIDGKRVISSLIRQARDPQLRLNHWASKEQELLNMAPVAPVMAVRGTLVNDRGQWQSPGTETALEYETKDLDGNPAPPPTRLNPPTIPTGIINAMQGAKDNIKESMGIYNAGLGKREGDASGVAIGQLQKEGDVATFHFPDNVRRSITQIGRILVSAAPEIYDTPRIVQIVNEETDPQMVGINGAPLQPNQPQAYDLTKGKYHVRVTTGASYTTKRQEAAKLFGDVIKSDPQLMNIIGDLWAKNLDVAGADAMASRLKKMIPPQLQDDNNQQDPRTIQLTQELQKAQAIIQQGAQEIQQLQAELQSKQGEETAKQQELQLKGGDQQLKAKELDLKMQVEQLKMQNETLKLQLEAEKLQLEREKMQAVTVPQQTPQQPIGIKLDTTGFQIAKTPEQEAMEAEQAQIQAQQEAEEKAKQEAEEQQKFAQSQVLLQTLGVIAQQIHDLTAQVSRPKEVKRDASGVIIGIE